MRMEGEFTVASAREAVYGFLTDPRQVSRHMPDVKDVQIEDDDHFTVTARVGIAHIKGNMVMRLAITDRNPPVGTTVVGKGAGLASVVDMTTSFILDPLEGGATRVRWAGELNVSGTLSSFGPQGLLDRMAAKNVETFVDGIKAGIAALPATSAV